MSSFHDFVGSLTAARKNDLFHLRDSAVSVELKAAIEVELAQLVDFIKCCQKIAPSDAPLDSGKIKSKP